MKAIILLAVHPFIKTVLILSLVVLIYSVAKAIMRYLDRNKK